MRPEIFNSALASQGVTVSIKRSRINSAVESFPRLLIAEVQVQTPFEPDYRIKIRCVTVSVRDANWEPVW